VSLLPIRGKNAKPEEQTIRYGSFDAGKTVHADDPILNKEMKKVAKFLNLAPHYAVTAYFLWINSISVQGRKEKKIYHCADIEGHEASDQVKASSLFFSLTQFLQAKFFYVIDFARV